MFTDKSKFNLTCVEEWTGTDGYGIHAKLNYGKKFLFWIHDDANGGGCYPQCASKEEFQLEKEVYAFCKTQPKVDSEWNDDGLEYNFDFLVADLANELNAKKEAKRMRAWLTRNQKKGVIYGTMEEMKARTFSVPLETVKFRGSDMLKKVIAEVKEDLGEGETILNTNLEGWI